MLHDLHPELGHAATEPFAEPSHIVPGLDRFGLGDGAIPPVTDHVIGGGAAGTGQPSASDLAYGDVLAPLESSGEPEPGIEPEPTGEAGLIKPPPRLLYGSRGSWVETLQVALATVGQPVARDGIFGGKTHRAVIAFQQGNSLGADGVVGKRTWGALLGIDFVSLASATAGAAGAAAGTATPATSALAAFGAAPLVATSGDAVAAFGPTDQKSSTGLSGFVGGMVRTALSAIAGPAQADAMIATIDQLIAGSPTLAVLDVTWLFARIALELPHEGPYGPAWMEAAGRGLLPSPVDATSASAAKVRFFVGIQDLPHAYRVLDALAMLDMVDVLRVLDVGDRAALEQGLATAGKGVDSARIGAAITTVTNRQATTTPGMTAADAAALEGFANLRNWPTVLPRAGRHGAQAAGKGTQAVASTRISATGARIDSGKPLLTIPDLGQRVDDRPQAEQDMVALIARHRARLPERVDLFVNQEGKGYQYNGVKGKETPAGLSSTPLGRNGIPAPRQRAIDEAVWEEMAGEGGEGAINAYDRELFSWGQGFSGLNGALRKVMPIVLQKSPAMRDLLLDAGITFHKGDWLWVNTETGRVEEGADALQLLRFDERVLSLFMDIAEDKIEGGPGDFGQVLADARFKVLTAPGHAGDVPAFAQGWDDKLIRFCAHCIWGGGSTWKTFNSIATVNQAAAAHAPNITKNVHLGGHKVGDQWSAAILTFAKGVIKSAATHVPDLPEHGDFTGDVFLKDPKKGWWIVRS